MKPANRKVKTADVARKVVEDNYEKYKRLYGVDPGPQALKKSVEAILKLAFSNTEHYINKKKSDVWFRTERGRMLLFLGYSAKFRFDKIGYHAAKKYKEKHGKDNNNNKTEG